MLGSDGEPLADWEVELIRQGISTETTAAGATPAAGSADGDADADGEEGAEGAEGDGLSANRRRRRRRNKNRGEGSEGAEGLLADVTAAMRAVRLAPEVGAGCLTSDAGLFRLHGLDALAFGAGGPIEELYQDDESIAVAKLESTAAFYEQLIARMCT